MKVGLGLSTIAMLGLVACGNSGSSGVNASTTTVQISPAGVATLNFLDLVSTVPPSALSGSGGSNGSAVKREEAASAVNPCITTTVSGNTTTYQLSAQGCPGANGTLTGSLQSVEAPAGTYTETFDITSTIDSTHKWTYTGQLQVAFTSATTATLTAPGTLNALVLSYQDTSTSSTANNLTYTFQPMLTADWTSGSMVLGGDYLFNGTLGSASGYTVSVTIPVNTTLTIPASGCNWPTSGSLSLGLTVAGNSAQNASVTATFGPGCGAVVLDGVSLTLGQ